MTYKEALSSISTLENYSAIKSASAAGVVNVANAANAASAVNAAFATSTASTANAASTASASAGKTANTDTTSNKTDSTVTSQSTPKRQDSKLQGTILRVSIPNGTAFNFLNLMEVSFPQGVNIVGSSPILASLAYEKSITSPLLGIMNVLKSIGGTLEILS